MEYNEALVIVENNSHGILTCTRLGKDMAYPAFYTEVQYDKLTDKESVRWASPPPLKPSPWSLTSSVHQCARANSS